MWLAGEEKAHLGPSINLKIIFSGLYTHYILHLIILVPAVCGGDVTVTTDMLATLATEEPAYVFASPGKSTRGPNSLILQKQPFLSFKCKPPRKESTAEKFMIRTQYQTKYCFANVFEEIYKTLPMIV